MKCNKCGNKIGTKSKVCPFCWADQSTTEKTFDESTDTIKIRLNYTLAKWCIPLGILLSWVGLGWLGWSLVAMPLVLYLFVLAAEQVKKLINMISGGASKTVAPNPQQLEKLALEKNDFVRLILTAIVIVLVCVAINMAQP